MGLPTITVPQYHLTVPSTGKEIKFRPFLVKEEKILLLAMEGDEQKQIVAATKEIVQNCIFGDIDVEGMPAFDLEYPSVAIAVFIPTNSPSRFSRAPPEFPGFIAASCCIKSSKLNLETTSLLPVELIIPAVTV